MTRSIRTLKSLLCRSLLVTGVLVGFAGCEEKGPMEKAGEQIDQGVENAKDTLDPAGPGEKAGEALDNAGEKASDALEKGGEKAGQALDNAGDKAAEALDNAADKLREPK